MYVCMYGWMDECMGRWMDADTDTDTGWTDGWMDGRMDGLILCGVGGEGEHVSEANIKEQQSNHTSPTWPLILAPFRRTLN